jgi:hypothetical protein
MADGYISHRVKHTSSHTAARPCSHPRIAMTWRHQRTYRIMFGYNIFRGDFSTVAISLTPPTRRLEQQLPPPRSAPLPGNLHPAPFFPRLPLCSTLFGLAHAPQVFADFFIWTTAILHLLQIFFFPIASAHTAHITYSVWLLITTHEETTK